MRLRRHATPQDSQHSHRLRRSPWQQAQPAMAPMFRLANDALWASSNRDAFVSSCRAYAERLETSDDLIAQTILEWVQDDSRVLTHSFSRTVLRALIAAHHIGRRLRVIATESRPISEGVALARELGASGIDNRADHRRRSEPLHGSDEPRSDWRRFRNRTPRWSTRSGPDWLRSRLHAPESRCTRYAALSKSLHPDSGCAKRRAPRLRSPPTPPDTRCGTTISRPRLSTFSPGL